MHCAPPHAEMDAAPDASAQSDGGEDTPALAVHLSKSARKKQMKQQMREKRKAERKAAEKERKRKNVERKRREWDEKLAGVSEEERARLVESRRNTRKERVERRNEERDMKVARLRRAAEIGQKLVIDLEFGHLMSPNEIHSLVQQVMYCYAVNSRSASPAHLWLTGCRGEIETHLQSLPGFEKWIIEKESNSYIEAFNEQKENMVYLTADADVELQELDKAKVYIIGGLVDRNRWKGITLGKAKEQGIQFARLPIGGYLKMSSSKVLTVNQVIEILLKFLETRDWKAAFFQVIPQRKMCEDEPETRIEEVEEEKEGVEDGNQLDEDSEVDYESGERKRLRVAEPINE